MCFPSCYIYNKTPYNMCYNITNSLTHKTLFGFYQHFETVLSKWGGLAIKYKNLGFSGAKALGTLYTSPLSVLCIFQSFWFVDALSHINAIRRIPCLFSHGTASQTGSNRSSPVSTQHANCAYVKFTRVNRPPDHQNKHCLRYLAICTIQQLNIKKMIVSFSKSPNPTIWPLYLSYTK